MMNRSMYDIVTAADRPELVGMVTRVTAEAWPEFMLHDPVSQLFPKLYEQLPQYQFAFTEPGTDNIVAIGNSIPLAWDDDPRLLPDTGWDWALQTGMREHGDGTASHILSALQIVIANRHLGKGLSLTAVETMKSIGRSNGLRAMVAPVRPSMKATYPLISMSDYIDWKNDEGLPFDPWMRVHVRSGASVIKVCPQSMRITGSVADWEGWTKMKFPQSGQYIIPGALAPVEFDIEADLGTYIEPNVWMLHNL
jgi:hypothetical protein